MQTEHKRVEHQVAEPPALTTTQRHNTAVGRSPVPGKAGRHGLHGLRYTRASIATELGESPVVTAAILGQSSAAITLDVYTSLPVEGLRSIALPINNMSPHQIEAV